MNNQKTQNTIDKDFGRAIKKLGNDIPMNLETKILKEYEENFGYFWDENPNTFDNIQDFISKALNKIKEDLLKTADAGEYEDLRREVENYFK